MSHHTVITYVLRKLRPMTAEELATECEISLSSARQCVNHLHIGRKVHIAGWVQTPKNQFAAIWANGEGDDEPKPVIEKPEPKPRRSMSPSAVKALAAEVGNPFATAMWNVAQGERT